MARFALLIFVLNINCFVNAQQLRVGVFNELNTNSAIFSVISGGYLITGDNRAIQTLKTTQNLFITREGDSIRCVGIEKDYGLFRIVQLNSMADSSSFSLRPIEPQSNVRYFDDNLELLVQLGKMQTINIVDIDKYIAGVVESEGGVKASSEYYKTQAVLCRTYVLSHLDRHTEENFYLCDGTHCQAYNGRNSGKAIILKAAFDTRGLVATDKDTVFIIAAFHSDCGGETESAKNVWLINKPYLKPVKDPYCQNQKNFRWEKKLTLEQWKNYLTENGFHIKPDISTSQLNFTQYSRRQYYRVDSDSITFRKIRTDLNLHSAFFSVEAKEGNMEIHGRGYGHGVGLCQEGAMQMSKLGYDFRKIINFYYQDVYINNITNVPESKNKTLKLLEKAN
jgi:stage II sporulation protein D